MTERPLLELADVRRRFGTRVVLDGVSLAVRPGEVHLVVGANGSGKSTLTRIAAGLLRAHGGTAAILGIAPREPEARRSLGFVGHQSGLYDDFSPLENLEFSARLFRLADSGQRIARTLDRVGLGKDRAVAVRRLSRGTVQRAAIARSLLHEPRLLIWDEPLTGLDGPSVERMVELVSALAGQGTGILLVSHDLEALWRLQARVSVLHRGRIALTADTGAPLAEFRARYGALLDG